MRRLRRDLGRRLNLDLDARELLVELADLERRERLEEACAERGRRDTAAVSLARRVDDVEAARHRVDVFMKTASTRKFDTHAASVPVPLSEPGESPILIICCVSSP